MVLLALLGCAYKVTLASLPTPATVTLPDGSSVLTPATVRLRWVPFGHQRITVTSPDHRDLAVDLRDREIRLSRMIGTSIWRPGTIFGAPRGEIRFVLVPEHGPSGTWSEEEVP